MTIAHIDRAKNPPTLIGEHGAAWEVDLPRARQLAGETEQSDATVAMWIVFAPWAHPLWAYYAIGAIHLRPHPARKPAKIYNDPRVTHEVVVFALDPLTVPETVNTAKLVKMTPVNFAGQWVVAERPNPVDLDRGAAAKVRATVEEILAGVLSPDTDFIREWVKRFSDSNLHR